MSTLNLLNHKYVTSDIRIPTLTDVYTPEYVVVLTDGLGRLEEEQLEKLKQINQLSPVDFRVKDLR